MAGYTDAVTRCLALKNGADLAYTEMISSEALIRDSSRTIKMMHRAVGEEFLAVQLFGSDPEVLGKAALIAAEIGADLLDLNAGCPVAKVVSKGAGAALGRDSVRLGESVAAMKESGLPVSVKIRSGWNEAEITWRDSTESVLRNGVDAIGIHPRTRQQAYGGNSDWTVITELVSASDVPIIGTGDLMSPEDGRRMLIETGCAALMFARGAIGRPEIFGRTKELLATGKAPAEPDRSEKLAQALQHLKLAAGQSGEDVAAREMKKHLAGYIRGWESSAEMRRNVMRAADYDALVRIIEDSIGSTFGNPQDSDTPIH